MPQKSSISYFLPISLFIGRYVPVTCYFGDIYRTWTGQWQCRSSVSSLAWAPPLSPSPSPRSAPRRSSPKSTNVNRGIFKIVQKLLRKKNRGRLHFSNIWNLYNLYNNLYKNFDILNNFWHINALSIVTSKTRKV